MRPVLILSVQSAPCPVTSAPIPHARSARPIYDLLTLVAGIDAR